MKRKILVVIIYIILIFATIKLLYNNITNNILIDKYKNGEYAENEAKALTNFDFSQNYVANYNYGNILYNNGEYEKAIEQYDNALEGFVPKDKECNIRINYALSICKTVQVDENDANSIEEAIEKYQSAVDILTEKGCANKNDSNGHNSKAQTLKEDIEREIERLKKLQQEGQQEEENNDDNQDGEGNKNPNEEEIENKIQDIKQSATQRQRQIETQFRNYGSNYDYSRIQKNW